MSRQLQLLEEELGVVLFTRKARGVTLTEGGERLYRHVNGLMHQFAQTREIARGDQGEVAGNLVIGMPSTACMLLARPFLAEALERYPKVQLRVVELIGSVLTEMVGNGSVDLAVLYNVTNRPGFEVVDLLVEDLCVVGRPTAALEGLSAIPFRQLHQLPLVLSSTAQTVRRQVESLAVAEGIELNIRLEVDSIYLLRHLVCSGVGFGVASQGIFSEEIASGEVRSYGIVDPGLRRTVSLVGSAHRRSLAGRHLHDLLQTVSHHLVVSGAWRAAQWIGKEM